MTELEIIEMLREAAEPIPIAIRQQLGCCRWGHPDYVRRTVDREGVVYWHHGDNAITRGTPDHGVTTYCRRCHIEDKQNRTTRSGVRSLRQKRARLNSKVWP